MVGIDNYTSLMLHMGNYTGQTTFTDSAFAAHTITASNANHQIAQYKFGGASAAFNGSSSYLSIPYSNAWQFGTGDFTIDCWVRFGVLNSWGIICTFGDDGSNNRCYFGKNTTNGLHCEFYIGGVGKLDFTTADNVIANANQWYHIALVRSGDNEYIFVDGVSKTLTYSINPTAATNLTMGGSLNFWIGKNFYGNYFNGYIDEFRISKGIARWTSGFSVPTSSYTVEPLEINHYTGLMLHCDGTDTSTTFTDDSGTPHTMTAFGTAQIDTADYKFNGASALFTSSGDYVSTPASGNFDFGYQDWTIDFWIKRNGSQPDFSGIIGAARNSSSIGWTLHFGYAAGGTANKLRLVSNATGSWAQDIVDTDVLPDLTWCHVALVREGLLLRLYVNGAIKATTTLSSANYNSSNNGLTIGRTYTDYNANYYTGWLDEIRITKGHARWSEAFTPPVAPYSYSVATIDTFSEMVLHFNGTDASTVLVDSSFNNSIFTPTGTAQLDIDQYKFGGASGLFDGNSDYFTSPFFNDLDLEAENFTIDFWVKFNSTAGSQGFFTRYTSASSYFYLALETGSIRFRDYNGDTVNFSRAYSFNTTDWFHIAVVRNLSTVRLFVNGTKQGADVAVSGSFTARAAGLMIGAFPTAAYWLNGWMDEFRWSKGIARWWADFTPPTQEYSLSSAVDVTITPNNLVATATIQTPDIVIPLTVIVDVLAAMASIETPTVGSIETVFPSVLTASVSLQAPTILISSSVFPSVLQATASIPTPAFPGLSTIRNATKILSFNPLVVVTNNNPLKIARIDVTVPSFPVSNTYVYPGVQGAQDIAYDSITDKVFISCKYGKILELDGSNFANYIIYDTGVSTDLKNIDILPGFALTFASVINPTGEVVVMDGAIKTVLSTDVRWIQLVTNFLNYHVNTVNAKLINLDTRWSGLVADLLKMDIRFTTIAPGGSETPLSRLDFHVFINNVEVFDVKMDSINIYHTEYEKSRATLVLARQHDNLDYTLEGVSSQITQQNPLRVTINGHIEFEGFIGEINANSEAESVTLTAYSVDPKADERSLVTLSLPSLNETLSLHHALVHNPRIENPYILPDDLNPLAYKGILVDEGYDEQQNISRWRQLTANGLQTVWNIGPSIPGGTFNSTPRTFVEYVMDGDFVPMQNWTYFWFAAAENFVTGYGWLTSRYIGTSPGTLTGDTWEVKSLSYFYQRKFPSKKTRLGTGIAYANDFKYTYTADAQAMYNALKPHGYITFNGTTIKNYEKQPSVYAILDSKLGYMLGSAPFKKVSSKSGRLQVQGEWVDNPDGLYEHKDSSYDYRDYARKIAALEYKKLQSINGSVLPKTSADIEIFIDAYYTYNIAMLKRINIDNTVKPNIYNNFNGFPLSVKSIEINSGTMKVVLHCDNQWSKTEMLEIEASYPNPEDAIYLFPETEKLQYTKFDPRTLGNIQ